MTRFPIIDRPERRQVEIYGYVETRTGAIPLTVDDEGQLEQHGIGAAWPGDQLPVTLRLDARDYHALREAMAGGPPSAPEHDALRDARTVRDRLLNLVEAEWTARTEVRS